MPERPPVPGRGPEARKEVPLTPEQVRQVFHDIMLAEARLVCGTRGSAYAIAGAARRHHPDMPPELSEAFKAIGRSTRDFHNAIENTMREALQLTEDEWHEYAGALIMDDLIPKIDPKLP